MFRCFTDCGFFWWEMDGLHCEFVRHHSVAPLLRNLLFVRTSSGSKTGWSRWNKNGQDEDCSHKQGKGDTRVSCTHRSVRLGPMWFQLFIVKNLSVTDGWWKIVVVRTNLNRGAKQPQWLNSTHRITIFIFRLFLVLLLMGWIHFWWQGVHHKNHPNGIWRGGCSNLTKSFL